MRVGDVEILPLNDGWLHAPAAFFGPTADFAAHQDLLGPDGTMQLPIGAFVLRTNDTTVLIDAGVGDVHNSYFDGGRLLDRLTANGLTPGDIDRVVCTHLHADHTGWVIDERDRSPVFGNAVFSTGAADWELFVEQKAGGRAALSPHLYEGLRALADADRVELLSGDAPIAPGVSCLAAPGHTPGHFVVVISSGTARALLLGDAITCPVQLEEAEWGAIADVDPALAARTRELLWRELETEGTVGTGAHFPDLEFGRVLSGEGRRWLT
ncbi:MBL fold metallo-hydrolase [Cryptosporangium aurantiacum]|uniref:Glyoxylase, beta-lactamase superfamily II n=1 Tax=Cryptosporangium aurantiacum TaxID=134849 RepID=A0A1M7PET0_9ACTN|nr:MBL fold metallo-hydrolase [Cryptosporangium aurantiacum]SHN15427.1 Glyoxylase, beta-lactamase superfamily II [Cryptosporangium aurantiacum]